MSIVYGVVSDTAAALDTLDSFFEAHWKQRPTRLTTSDTRVALSVAGTGGCFGRADDQHFILVYSGFVQAPFPDWPEGRPIDAPNEVASRLLSRYLISRDTFLDDVIGQFVVVIAHKQLPHVLVFCDSTGFRKAFYARTPRGVFFSTSLHLLSAAFPSGAAANRAIEDFYLGYEIVPECQTIYKDVYAVRAAGLIIDADHLEVLPSAKPAEFARKEGAKEESKVIKELYEVFMETMRLLLPADKRVGVALGGFDSALVASALSRLGKQVETYTFSFDRPEMNQDKIREFCQAIPVDHHWVKIDSTVISKGLVEYGLWFNQIASQPHYLIQFSELMEAMRRRGISHAFTGDGCDEVFLGYPIVHKRAVAFSRAWRLPGFVRDSLLRLLSFIWLERHLGQPLRVLRNVLTILGREEPTRGHITNRIFDDASLAQLRKGINPPQIKASEQILEDLAAGLESLSPVRRAYHGKSAPGLNATRNEGSISRSGVTIQSPYSHPLLKSFAQTLPDEFYRPKNEKESANKGKYILMRMAEVHGLLPPSVIYQPKASPVTSPVDYWFIGELHQLVGELLRDLPFDYDSHYAAELYRYRFAEERYRKAILGRFAFKNVSLLITYARFFSIHGVRR